MLRVTKPISSRIKFELRSAFLNILRPCVTLPAWDSALVWWQGRGQWGGRRPLLAGRIRDNFVEETGFKDFRIKGKYEKVMVCSGNRESGLIEMCICGEGWQEEGSEAWKVTETNCARLSCRKNIVYFM